MVLYEGVAVDESNNPSAPSSLPAPYPGFQDAPPSYDEAVLGKSKQSDGQGPPPYPNQPGLPIKGEFHVPVTQFGPGPPTQPPEFAEVPGVYQTVCADGNEDDEFRKRPIKARCQNCGNYNFTRVDERINSEGWLWCILCCCCGIWLLSLLVKCMDGFREFNHYCTQCGKKVASYSPNFTAMNIVLLIVLALLAVTLIGFACYFRMIQESMHH